MNKPDDDAALERAETAKAEREVNMPDSKSALRALTDAHHRLKELGWRDAKYAPKDGSQLELIEPGSGGVHRGYWSFHNGRDGAGCFWIPTEGDLWPSHPILFRPLPTGDSRE